jgi:hypothetical protein
MKSKVDKKNEDVQCIHHWMLRDSNDGKGTSIGFCKKCNEKKEFNNFVPYYWRNYKKK